MSKTKKDFVENISEKTNILEDDVNLILTSFIDEIKETLLKEEKVVLENFISLETLERKGRNGFHPRDKKPIYIPAKKYIKIFESRKMKEDLQKLLN